MQNHSSDTITISSLVSLYHEKPFEMWEDVVIVKGHSAGKQWEQIAEQLNHRSESDIKWRWTNHLQHLPFH